MDKHWCIFWGESASVGAFCVEPANIDVSFVESSLVNASFIEWNNDLVCLALCVMRRCPSSLDLPM